MSAVQETLPPPSTALRLLEVRVVPEFGAFWLMRPWLTSVTRRGDGHPVLVLPGLLADDGSTHALRSFLNSHGYMARGWKLGRNFGLRANLKRDMLARIDELFEGPWPTPGQPGGLEPRRTLCSRARQDRTRQSALPDQSRQPLRRLAQVDQRLADL